jgi:TetR/AcrR family acrAB operon transcriptional repressor
MRRTKEEAAKTRQDLLNTALTVFSRDGYEAARMADIAKLAGVTRGAIYHHFGSKADLFIALIDDASKSGNSAVTLAMEKDLSFVDTIKEILVKPMSLLEQNKHFREVMALSLFMSGSSPELAGLQRRRYEEARELVENVAVFFQMGIDQGEIRPDIDPLMAARAFIAYQNGLSLLWLSNQDAFSIQKNAEELASIFICGLVGD